MKWTIPPILLAAAYLPAQSATAAPLNWPDTVYPYVAVEQDLRDVLTALGRNMDVGIRLTDKVTGKVQGKLPAMSPEKFLNHLARTYGLVWYYDGQVLEVSTVHDVVSRVVSLEKPSFKKFRMTLQALQVWDDRYPLRVAAGTGVVLVSGPRRYVELVAQTAKELEKTAPRSVRVLRGSGGGASGSGAASPETAGSELLNNITSLTEASSS